MKKKLSINEKIKFKYLLSTIFSKTKELASE